MAIIIPENIQNTMRRTRFTNNHEFWETLPKYMKEPNKDKSNRLLILNFINKNLSEKDYIEKVWRDLLEDQKKIKSK